MESPVTAAKALRRTRPWRVALLAVMAASVASLGLAPMTAAAAAVPQAPSVVLAQPTFTGYESDFDETGFNYWTADFTFQWTVSAPAGVCAQTLTFADYDTLGGDVDPVLGDSETVTLPNTARSYAAHSDAYDFMRSGYSAVIRITDCNGKNVTSNPVHAVVLPGEDTDAAMGYSKGWSVSHCTCFSGGTTHFTTTKNATVTFRTATPIDASGVRLALIMAKAPNRGSAAVYVDGVLKATISTYSKTNVNRAIVYQLLLPGSATHVVKVVNLATAGHPRIDVDATLNGG
jgi:FlaG/FlaF family flagellin (archaellin)